MSLVGEPLPKAAACIETYTDVWAEFGASDFDLDDLVGRLIERDSHDRPSRSDLQARLDLLVASGLLRWDGRERFQVWCKPDESVADWNAKVAPRIEEVHDRVREAMARRDRPGTSATSEEELLEYGGETYASTFVDVERPAFDEQLAAVVDALDSESAHELAGVVFRTPGDNAAPVQRLADRFCDADAVAELSCPYRFEKETSSVVGNDTDHLEYRLFLRATGCHD